MPTNYTIRPGDTLSKIASSHGFNDYRHIYNHPSNANFRAKRPNPNLIYPGDVIVIPDKAGKPPTQFTPPSFSSTSYVLSLPPLISQVLSTDCWAAGLASFQRVTRINPAASRENLKVRYGICLSYDPSGNLPEQCVPPVFRGEGCLLQNVPPTPFNYRSIKNKLKRNGHLVAIRHSGYEVYHMLVIYGVGVAPNGTPDIRYFSVMNPGKLSYRHAGYENLAFATQKIVAVGIRHAPSPKHIHP